ncbi:MAG: hypothetical protein NTX81_10685, partial [Candidatus Bathyarchaeota archaeon]|nr:hypothetical protein [Candidatus Bathyarchaeota archaeon]
QQANARRQEVEQLLATTEDTAQHQTEEITKIRAALDAAHQQTEMLTQAKDLLTIEIERQTKEHAEELARLQSDARQQIKTHTEEIARIESAWQQEKEAAIPDSETAELYSPEVLPLQQQNTIWQTAEASNHDHPTEQFPELLEELEKESDVVEYPKGVSRGLQRTRST